MKLKDFLESFNKKQSVNFLGRDEDGEDRVMASVCISYAIEWFGDREVESSSVVGGNLCVRLKGEAPKRTLDTVQLEDLKAGDRFEFEGRMFVKLNRTSAFECCREFRETDVIAVDIETNTAWLLTTASTVTKL